MKGWRTINHNNKLFWWRVSTDFVLVRKHNGPVIVRKTLYDVTGMSPDDRERAAWKGSPLPAITPSMIIGYIDEA